MTARVDYLLSEKLLAPAIVENYSPAQLVSAFERAEQTPYRFSSYIGALKFFTSYALTSRDGAAILESYEHRVCAVSLALARGDMKLSEDLFDLMIDGTFHLTTPAFANLGKTAIGEPISCYLVRVEDNMESVSRGVNDAMQLSRRNGGMAFLLTNIRERGDAVDRRLGHAPGVVPIMKLLEDALAYAHQGGQRPGAGAVYLHAHHPEILRFLDTKKENADERIRIKSLSLGVVVPDITFELARENEPMLLFSPRDVLRETGQTLSDIDFSDRYRELEANPRIRRTSIDARELFLTIASVQFESGYPYLLFEDNANRASPIPGRITHSNLCSEILQVSSPSALSSDLSYEEVGTDITCNLGSFNIAHLIRSGVRFGTQIDLAVRALTAASEGADLSFAPALARGRDEARSIGVGQMNLHGFLLQHGIAYGSQEALDFTSAYFAAVTFHVVSASNRLARERGRPFEGFERSSYADGRWFERYVNHSWAPTLPMIGEIFMANGVLIPSPSDWRRLEADVREWGLYNRYLQAVAPTGAISYMNHSTASILPAPARVEVRVEGSLGRLYHLTPHLTNESVHAFQDAFEMGAAPIIETYARAAEHVDQGLSLTLFFESTATTRDINRAQIHAWSKGLKTLYYVRIRQHSLAGGSSR